MSQAQAPLRRRWGVADGVVDEATTEDGVAPVTPASTFWRSSAWFAGGASVDAVAQPVASAVGGAASQSRLGAAAAQRQPFAPTTAKLQLSSSVAVADGVGFEVTASSPDAPAAWRRGPARTLAPPSAASFTFSWERQRWEAGGTAVEVANSEVEMLGCGASELAPSLPAAPPALDAACRAARLARLAAAGPPVEPAAPFTRCQKAFLLPASRQASRAAPRHAVFNPTFSSSCDVSAPSAVFAPFRLASGDVVFVRCGAPPAGAAPSPRDVARCAAGEAAWPAVHALEVSRALRHASLLPSTSPGPEMVGARLTAARAEMASWAEEQLRLERDAEEAEEASAGGGAAQEAPADGGAGADAAAAGLAAAAACARLAEAREALRRERAWAAALEDALRQAGVAFPPRP